MFNNRVVLVALAVCGAVSNANKEQRKDEHRMYGSQDAADGQFPYAVFHILRTSRGFSTCSGSLLTAQWVLLAAHCVNRDVLNPTNHIVVAGKANLNAYLARRYRVTFQTDLSESRYDVQERRAERVYHHPSYTRAGNNDVGLIHVNRPFNLNNRVSVINLAREPMGGERNCELAGYGIVEGNQRKHILQYIRNMPARPAAMCRHQRTRDVICLGDISRGICHGDSGGPIVCQGTQRGVASHGISRGSGSNCGIGTVEQYYTDTYLNVAWIDSVMGTTPGRQRGKVKPKLLDASNATLTTSTFFPAFLESNQV